MVEAVLPSFFFFFFFFNFLWDAARRAQESKLAEKKLCCCVQFPPLEKLARHGEVCAGGSCRRGT